MNHRERSHASKKLGGRTTSVLFLLGAALCAAPLRANATTNVAELTLHLDDALLNGEGCTGAPADVLVPGPPVELDMTRIVRPFAMQGTSLDDRVSCTLIVPVDIPAGHAIRTVTLRPRIQVRKGSNAQLGWGASVVLPGPGGVAGTRRDYASGTDVDAAECWAESTPIDIAPSCRAATRKGLLTIAVAVSAARDTALEPASVTLESLRIRPLRDLPLEACP